MTDTLEKSWKCLSMSISDVGLYLNITLINSNEKWNISHAYQNNNGNIAVKNLLEPKGELCTGH